MAGIREKASTPFFQKVRIFRNALFSKKYLFYTNVALSSSLAGVGDIIEQTRRRYVKGQDKFDFPRTYRMFAVGATLGTLAHNWYVFLEWFIPGRTYSAIFKKVAMDTLIYSPVQVLVFFAVGGLLRRETLDEIVTDVGTKGKFLLIADFVTWPPAQVINFYWVPLKYRLLYDNLISLGFDVFMSYLLYDTDQLLASQSAIAKYEDDEDEVD